MYQPISHAQFLHLSQALPRKLEELTGKTISVTPYPAEEDPNLVAGVRAELSTPNWTAAFFFWYRSPKGWYPCQLEVRILLHSVHSMVFPLTAILLYLDPEDFRYTAVDDLRTEQELSDSLEWLWSIIEPISDKLDELCQEPEPLVRQQDTWILTLKQEELLCSADNGDSFLPDERPCQIPDVGNTYTRKDLQLWYLYCACIGHAAYFQLLGMEDCIQSIRRHPPTYRFPVEEAILQYVKTHDALDYDQASPAVLAIWERVHDYDLNDDYWTADSELTPYLGPLSAEDEEDNEHLLQRDQGLRKEQEEAQRQEQTDEDKTSFWNLLPEMLLGALILTPLWLIIYFLLYSIDLQWASEGMQWVVGTDWLEAVLCAWVTAFACAFAVAPNVVWLLHKRSPMLKQKIALAKRLKQDPAHTIIVVVIWVIVSLCAVHLFFYSHTGLAFAANGFYDRQEAFDVKGTYHPYSQVVSLKEVTSSAGLLGDYNDYLITLKDGTTYSLSSQFGASSVTVEQHIVPLLEEAGVTIHLMEETVSETAGPSNT